MKPSTFILIKKTFTGSEVEVAKEFMEVKVPTYTDFDKMVKETRPDSIIVTTVDSTRHEHIIRGMELGC